MSGGLMALINYGAQDLIIIAPRLNENAFFLHRNIHQNDSPIIRNIYDNNTIQFQFHHRPQHNKIQKHGS